VDNRPVVKGGYGPGWEVGGSMGWGIERRKDKNSRILEGVRFVFRRMERYESIRLGGCMPKMQDDAIYEMIVVESGEGGDEVYR